MSGAAIFSVGRIIAFALGAYLWRVEAVTIGTIYLIYHYTELIQRPIHQIRNQLTDLQQADAGIGRIQTLLETESRLSESEGRELAQGPLPVEFQHLSFSYEDQPEEKILDNVNFTLESGCVLGLLGRTGSGKTTLARLLLRLYDPTQGRLLVGGREPKEVPLALYRRHIGMVTQDVQLFQASVRDNLTFFRSTIDDQTILNVLDDLGLRSWLDTLPDGLDTMLEAGGGGLSAGQAQLLAFARVFLDDPGLVILDEASSRLDPATEQLIERAVDKLLHNRTAILIAHRLGTVQRADEILILEQGRIVEHGDRIVLANNSESRFAQLLRTGMEEVLV
ncbi:ABC transporter ATP-binding protein/permease [Chloroflexi bacterium TSY]|nr:ABC transporter ATP-binding protein/permease [Chloroflexi bacterium TSY]